MNNNGTGHVQTQLLHSGLDWLTVDEVARLYGLEGIWLLRELVGNRMPSLQWKIAAGTADNPLTGGILLWQPSVEVFLATHRELLVGSMGLLRRDGGTA